MSEYRPEDLRVSDTERDAALSALGEHMSTGRLDVTEYGERSAQVTAAKTRGDLEALFTDLPEPHPVFGVTQSPAAAPEPRQPAQQQRSVSRVGQRLASAAMPIAGIIGVILFFAVGGWWWFLLPAAVACAGGALFGDDFKSGGCGGGRTRRRELHAERHIDRIGRRMDRMQHRGRW